MAKKIEAQLEEFLDRAVENILPDPKKFKSLIKSKKISIYLGVDPTGAHLHLGHATNLLLLKLLQRLGHKVIFLIGDFTARIGDPTDKLAARKPLTEREIKQNLKTFTAQASKIISFTGRNAVQVRFNADWLAKLSFADLVKIAANFTVQQMLKREMFQKRLADNKPIGLHEFLYPLMQGYDSVALNVDAELGGNDQTFNMLVGRDLLRIYKKKEKFVIATKLLINPKTGLKMMNKSEGGMINLDDRPNDMFGKVMAIDDDAMFELAKLATLVPSKEISKLEKSVNAGLNPKDAKLQIAEWIVSTYFDQPTAVKAKERFVATFAKKKLPQEAPKLKVKPRQMLVDLLVSAGVPSKSEARRLIAQKGVKLNGRVQSDPNLIINPKTHQTLQIGKRRFFKLA